MARGSNWASRSQRRPGNWQRAVSQPLQVPIRPPAQPTPTTSIRVLARGVRPWASSCRLGSASPWMASRARAASGASASRATRATARARGQGSGGDRSSSGKAWPRPRRPGPAERLASVGESERSGPGLGLLDWGLASLTTSRWLPSVSPHHGCGCPAVRPRGHRPGSGPGLSRSGHCHSP